MKNKNNLTTKTKPNDNREKLYEQLKYRGKQYTGKLYDFDGQISRILNWYISHETTRRTTHKLLTNLIETEVAKERAKTEKKVGEARRDAIKQFNRQGSKPSYPVKELLNYLDVMYKQSGLKEEAGD